MNDPDGATGSGGASRHRYLPTRGQVLRVLTATQNSSALVFTVFLGAHLAAPLAASLGSAEWADKTMMITREYYLPYEPLVVYAPLGLHLLSSTLRRALITLQTRRRPQITTHLLTGWLLPLFLFPHIGTHRIFPSSPDTPISALSPSELNFEYVGWGIRTWPVWSVVSYGGLVLFGCWHAATGLMKCMAWLRGPRVRPAPAPASADADTAAAPGRPKISKRRKVGLRGGLAVLLGVIAIGLTRVARDTKGVSRFMEKRYEAVYALVPWSGYLR